MAKRPCGWRLPNAIALAWSLAIAGLQPSVTAADDFAASYPFAIDNAVIGSGALAGVHGRTAVNIVAGNGNAQANDAAIAIGRLGAASQIETSQLIDQASSGSTAAFVFIGDRAFATATGLLSVNQASGTGNAQTNASAIVLGGTAEVVSDHLLAGSAAASGPPVSGISPPRMRGAAIAPTAFEGARGLVQVNQSAGTANTTANSFALRVQTGGQ